MSSERRRDHRAQLRTVVNIYTEASMAKDPPEFVRGWSEDISATGAKLITVDPIQDKNLWLRFLLPGQPPCFIQAEVMRGEQAERGFKSQAMHWYGVRFQRLLSEKEFMELAMTHIERLTSGLSQNPLAEPAAAHAQS